MAISYYRLFMEGLIRSSGPTFQRWDSFLSSQPSQLPDILEAIDQDLLEQIHDEQVVSLISRKTRSCLSYPQRRQLVQACQRRVKTLAAEAGKFGLWWFRLAYLFRGLFRLALLGHLFISLISVQYLIAPPDYAFEEQSFLQFHGTFWLSLISVKVFSRLIWRLKTERQPFFFKQTKTLWLVLGGVFAAVLTLIFGTLLIIYSKRFGPTPSELPYLMIFVYLLTLGLVIPLWAYRPHKKISPGLASLSFLSFSLEFFGQLIAIGLMVLSPEHRVFMLYLIPYLLVFLLRVRYRYQDTMLQHYHPAVNRPSYHISRLLRRATFGYWFSFLLVVGYDMFHSNHMEVGELVGFLVIHLLLTLGSPLLIKFFLKDDLLYLEKGQEISWSNDLVYLIYRGVYGYRKSTSPQVNSWLESYRFWHCVEHQGLGIALQHDFFIEHVDMFHQQLERWECSYAAAFFTDLILHLELEKLPKSERKISTLKAGAEQFMAKCGLLVQEQEDRLLQQIPLIKWHLHQDYRALKADFKFAEALE